MHSFHMSVHLGAETCAHIQHMNANTFHMCINMSTHVYHTHTFHKTCTWTHTYAHTCISHLLCPCRQVDTGTYNNPMESSSSCFRIHGGSSVGPCPRTSVGKQLTFLPYSVSAAVLTNATYVTKYGTAFCLFRSVLRMSTSLQASLTPMYLTLQLTHPGITKRPFSDEDMNPCNSF